MIVFEKYRSEIIKSPKTMVKHPLLGVPEMTPFGTPHGVKPLGIVEKVIYCEKGVPKSGTPFFWIFWTPPKKSLFWVPPSAAQK